MSNGSYDMIDLSDDGGPMFALVLFGFTACMAAILLAAVSA